MTVTLFGGVDLVAAIKATAPASLLRYWPRYETTGTSMTDLSGNAGHGTYQGTTLAAITTPFATPAPSQDAINDVDIAYTAALSTALANNGEGTAFFIGKMRATSVWSDAAQRRGFALSDAANTNLLNLQKNTTANQLRVSRTVGGATLQVAAAVSGTANWFALAMTWSVSNNRLRAWYSEQGVQPAQLGTTQTGVTAWSGVTLDSAQCSVGGLNNTTATQLWDGYLAHVALWTVELDPTTQLYPLMRL